MQSSLHFGGVSGFCRLLLFLCEEGFLVLLQTWVQAAFSGAADVKSGYGGDTPCPAVAFAAACGGLGYRLLLMFQADSKAACTPQIQGAGCFLGFENGRECGCGLHQSGGVKECAVGFRFFCQRQRIGARCGRQPR